MDTRYFTHVDGFPGPEAYVIVIGTNSIIVRKDGTQKPSKAFRLSACESFVRRGFWREITKSEAERLVTT